MLLCEVPPQADPQGRKAFATKHESGIQALKKIWIPIFMGMTKMKLIEEPALSYK